MEKHLGRVLSMIQIDSERLIALADVPAILPRRRGGKRVNSSCIYRWAQRGLRGIRLETLQCGGTKVTSKEALARFFRRLEDVNPVYAESVTPLTGRRQREHGQDDQYMTREGL